MDRFDYASCPPPAKTWTVVAERPVEDQATVCVQVTFATPRGWRVYRRYNVGRKMRWARLMKLTKGGS